MLTLFPDVQDVPEVHRILEPVELPGHLIGGRIVNGTAPCSA